jgi:hypothetical protein
MADSGIFWVIRREGGWEVKREGSRVADSFLTEGEATAAAIERARNCEPGRVRIQRADGKVEPERTYWRQAELRR